MKSFMSKAKASLKTTLTTTSTTTRSRSKSNKKHKDTEQVQTGDIPLPFQIIPDNVIVQLLRTIISIEGPWALQSFINAYPQELARFILIISDSLTDHRTLLKIPQAHSIDLGDYCDAPWDSLRTTPIQILCFSEVEESSVSNFLNTFSTCPYARFMSPFTPVIFQTVTKTSMPYQLIEKHCREQGVVDMFHLYSTEHVGYAELDGTMDVIPTNVVQRSFQPFAMESPPMFPMESSLGLLKYTTNEPIYYLDIHDYDAFDEKMYFPYVETMRVRFNKECRKGLCRDDKCVSKRFTIVSGMLSRLYVSFDSMLGPIINDTRAPSELFGLLGGSVPRETFTLVNTNWSFTNPYGRSLCKHFTLENGKDQAYLLTMKSSRRWRFTRTFTKINFIGVPDLSVISADLSLATHLRWKRLSPLEGSSNVMGDFEPVVRFEIEPVIFGPSLTHVHIFDKVHLVEGDKNPMIPLNAPLLRYLALFELEGSQSPLDLRKVIHGNEPTKNLEILHISTLQLSTETNRPLILPIRNLSPARSSLAELHIMGYTPSFCLANQPSSSTAFTFLNLDYIRIDVSSIPRTTQNATIALTFPQSTFPSLLTVCLDLYDEGNISGRCPPTTMITIDEIPGSLDRMDVNTLIRSGVYVCGDLLAGYDGGVKVGDYGVWKKGGDGQGFTFERVLKEKSYKEWVYAQ